MHLIPSFTLEGFYLGPAYIYTWGLTAAIGVIVAVWLAEKKVVSGQPACRQGRWPVASKKISENKFWNLVILLIIAVFLGARIFYIFETWNYYTADPLAALRLWEGGFSLFGGVAGGLIPGYFWGKKNKIDFLTLGWLFTPAWLFGLFFGRVGCFLIHDHLGQLTNLPWGVFVAGAYRHEPAMYEALWVLMLGVVLLLLDRKYNRNCHPERAERVEGSIPYVKILFPLSLLLYSLGRFFIDFTRADDPHYMGFTVAQWFCVVVVVWVIFLLSHKKTKPPDG